MTVAELIEEVQARPASPDRDKLLAALARLPSNALIVQFDESPPAGTVSISFGDLSGSRGMLAY